MNSTQIGIANGIVLLLLLFVCFSIAFIAHKYIDLIEGDLPGCSYVSDTRKVWGSAGLLGKVMRGGIIATIIMMPKIHAKRGLVDGGEVEGLPRYYKRLLVTPIAFGGILIFCLVALSIASHLIKQ
ncbi:hypothetical protein NLO85_23545 [Pseudomonas savastanoi]|uniref:Inner membrane protein n=1 Tax=Pseudomonas savastanoi TaxID=29438 RepID=A0AAW5J6V9_PSESS|nr:MULTISPECIES: hypothetical protein [Pseudomonas]MBA4702822.1 hypothetical protein [Pseudomonas savastanoi pv. savastanoi]MCQ3023462.1 hypothetical protein [Pseudomonas savastanoi]TSC36785.1 hypothetical protein FOM00_12135 [Pseudomonas sp. ST1]UKL12301.1 hypothetical protein HQ966_13520 [Pseudomonas savastanoi pv. savastanoi]